MPKSMPKFREKIYSTKNLEDHITYEKQITLHPSRLQCCMCVVKHVINCRGKKITCPGARDK